MPLHIDVFALFIFLGTVQGIFLSLFFLSKENRSVKSNIFLGLLLIAASLLSIDILLSYTNAMFSVIYLVDVTEPLNFVIGPAFYLYVFSKLDEERVKRPKLHFIPALMYLIYATLFFVQSTEGKYNSYLDQYHPELPFAPAVESPYRDPLFLQRFVNELTIISIAIYVSLAAYRVFSYARKEATDSNRQRLFKLLRFDVGFMAAILLTIIFVKATFTNDFGDYIIITAVGLFIYSISFNVMRGSAFFQGKQFEKKYSKSSLDEETKERLLEKILHQFEVEKYHTSASPTLPDLAKKLHATTNNVSQVINERLQLSFPDLLAKYRIEEAQRMMRDPANNDTVEGIAYSVGYHSKSTFHSAFKRFTGQTPAEYKASLKS